jgi:O-antigen ligase
VTDLFRFSLFVGVPLNITGAFSLLVIYSYIFLNLKLLLRLFQTLFLKFLFLLLVVYPIFLLPFHFLYGYVGISDFIRFFLNNLLYLGITITTVILLLKSTSKFATNITLSIVFITLFGIVLDYVFPGLFYALKLKVWGIEKKGFDYSTIEITRVGGFFLKSTAAASSLAFLLPALLLLLSRDKIVRIIFIYLLITILILLTGSRSGLIVMAGSFFFVLLGILNIAKKKLKTTSSKILGIGTLFTPVVVFTSILTMGIVLNFFNPKIQNTIVERVNTLTSLNRVANDESVSHRTSAQRLYISKILCNPLLGYGASYGAKLRQRGEFRFSSHNTLLELAFMFGLVYLCTLLFFYVLLLMLGNKVTGNSVNIIILSTFIFFSYSFFVNTLFQNRAFFFTLGVVLYAHLSGLKSNINDEKNYKYI